MNEHEFKIFKQPFTEDGTLVIIQTGSLENFDVKTYNIREVVDLLNEQQVTISALKEENGQLRLELETHKHPLRSTREAERKVNTLADSLADEVKKNGLLNEEINQLRIENMRLKKKW